MTAASRIAPFRGLATVTERSRVVFLSYASQDAAAALRIADALRTAGIEVWLDQSDLRGGDAWDRQIRDLIRECRLFVPLISANTEARDEGYFRREWKLAVERTHDMSERKAFLVPVVIDDTPQRGASVPEKFRDVQWTSLPAGERSPEFITRISRLLSADPAETEPAAPRAPSGAGAPRHSVRQDAVGAELVAAHPQRSSSRTQERQPTRSVAVLPFANLSSDREQEYFSDGLTEELINHLAHVRGLRVLARTSSFAFKGKNEDLRVIGQKLGVGCIVEGSVRKAGNRLRITAQLVECADGYHLWSETFDRDLGDVFAIQNDISQSVASALGVALGFGDDATTGGTRNLEAYDLYLRGRALYRLIAPLEVKRAADLFRQALALDPEFALAWVGLSATLVLMATYIPEAAAQIEHEWERAVERALHLAPTLAAAHAADVAYQMMRHHWLEADESFRKAKTLASTGEPVAFCALLGAVGRVNEAASEGRIVRAADPLSLIASSILQIVLTAAAEFDEADKEYIRSRDLTGDRTAAEHIALIRAWARGLPSSDRRACLQRYLDHASVVLPVERELLELLDRPDAARDRLRLAFEDAAYQDPTRQFKIATWAAQFGDVDLALGAARRAFMDMRSWSVYVIWLPTFREVRKHPRFKELVRDLGIVDYWRTSGNWGEFARTVGRDDFEIW